MSNNALIVDLITEMRDDLKRYVARTEQHEVKLKDILGNGQPGRLAEVEKLAQDLENWKWKLVGITIGLIIIIEGAHTGFDKLFEFLH